MMYSRIKKMWIRELNKTTIRQGFRALRYANGSMCPLGVLCLLYERDTWNRITTAKKDIPYCFIGKRGNVQTLPKEVREWAGVSSSPCVQYGDDVASIAWLNDVKKLTFRQIAYRISRTKDL